MYRQAYLARRLFIMIVAVTLVMCIIWLQVIHLEVTAIHARPGTTVAEAREASPMGTVADRHGHVLAVDRPLYEVYVDGRVLTDDQKRMVVARLAELGAQPDTLRAVAEALDHDRVAGIPAGGREEADNLEKNLEDLDLTVTRDWAWVDVRWVRHYPNGPLALHVLGYRNLNGDIQGGVHESYRDFLTSCRGLDPDHRHRAELPGGVSPLFPSPFRCDLVLTIDAVVQYTVEQVLDRAMETYRPHSGTVIVMDPHDGALLALAVRPVYDPRRTYTSAQEALEGLKNRAIQTSYEPGSVMKAITFATAYDADVIREDTTIEDEAEFPYLEGVIRNSQGQGYGRVSPRVILAKSLNVATAKVAIRTGPDIFYRYLAAFGFGRPTEADLGHESRGIVHWPGREDWGMFDLATNAFGQGISVTPMQLIRAMAVLANEGMLVQPHALLGYYKQDTYFEVEWPPVRRVVRPETARVVTDWLTGVIDEMARLGQPTLPGIRVAGKTGTAEIAENGGYGTEDRNVTFVGYFPAENPRVVILVMLERPQTGPDDEPVTYLWAYNTAYPVFVQVAEAILPYLER